jgi:hypothetical protein
MEPIRPGRIVLPSMPMQIPRPSRGRTAQFGEGKSMNSIIYLVGLVVVVLAVLSLIGLA